MITDNEVRLSVYVWACREKYKVLARHEVAVPEEQLERLDSLNEAWAQYLEMLEEAQGKLERHKDNFREKVGVRGLRVSAHAHVSLLRLLACCCVFQLNALA